MALVARNWCTDGAFLQPSYARKRRRGLLTTGADRPSAILQLLGIAEDGKEEKEIAFASSVPNGELCIILAWPYETEFVRKVSLQAVFPGQTTPWPDG